jgi:ribosomal-protein-alanine N-acetyltransferase
MKTNIKIRRAERNDLEQIHTLENSCFEIPWSYEMLYEDICVNKGTVYYVVEEEGFVVGYGGMWIILDEAHITNVCIAPDKRRHGYAMLLMKKLCDKAQSLGADSMTLEVRVSNHDALHLYKKCGFTIHGLRKRYYSNNNEDAYIMWREGTIQLAGEN